MGVSKLWESIPENNVFFPNFKLLETILVLVMITPQMLFQTGEHHQNYT